MSGVDWVITVAMLTSAVEIWSVELITAHSSMQVNNLILTYSALLSKWSDKLRHDNVSEGRVHLAETVLVDWRWNDYKHIWL